MYKTSAILILPVQSHFLIQPHRSDTQAPRKDGDRSGANLRSDKTPGATYQPAERVPLTTSQALWLEQGSGVFRECPGLS